MAVHPHEIDRGYPFDEIGSDIFTGNTAHILDKLNGGKKYKNRSITIKNGKAVLAANGERVIGSFIHFHSGKAVVRVASAGTRYKNAAVTAMAVGSKIVGASRSIVDSGVAENGFIRAAVDPGNSYVESAANETYKGAGYVTNGGGAYVVDSDPIADVIVMQSMGS